MLVALINRITSPGSSNPDEARKERILNVLLGASEFLVITFFLIDVINYLIFHGDNHGLEPLAVLSVLLPLVILHIISLKGRSRLSSYLFLLLVTVASTYALAIWGILLPQAILLYGFIIVLSGILIGGATAFIMSLILFSCLLCITILGNNQIISFDLSWANEAGGYNDSVAYGATFICISFVSWLYNHEIQSSLNHAREAERLVARERDMLEIKVKERTQEIEKMQIEKNIELLKFAEFGKLSSALLHELTSPLTSVSLNLEQMESKKTSKLIRQAREGISYIEQYVLAARKQLRNQGEVKNFEVCSEVKRIIRLIKPRAASLNIDLQVIASKRVYLRGDLIKFNQIVANLISNALDACAANNKKKKRVSVSVYKAINSVQIVVKDNGVGINEKDINRIFTTFFTTKSSYNGMGIGLSITHKAVTEDFNGSITVKSTPSKGSVFRIDLPCP